MIENQAGSHARLDPRDSRVSVVKHVHATYLCMEACVETRTRSIERRNTHHGGQSQDAADGKAMLATRRSVCDLARLPPHDFVGTLPFRVSTEVKGCTVTDRRVHLPVCSLLADDSPRCAGVRGSIS